MSKPKDTRSGHRSLPCASATLRRATRAVTQMYDEGLRPAGLRSTQYTILDALARAKRITQGDLGDVLAIDSTTLSRTMRILEKQGLVASAEGEDRRERHWSLTPAGRELLAVARPRWDAVQRRLRRQVGDAHWETLWSVCDELVRAARR